MVVVQAEKELQLTDEQFSQFLRRLNVLQMARRRGENQRNRALMELRRVMQASPEGKPDEGQIREQLKALDEVESQSALETRQARLSLDQILDVRQQARFRLLEQQIERRKLELFARSKQATPPK
jgi:phage terminase small subunit